MRVVVFLLLLFLNVNVYSNEESILVNESELSIVINSGNSESQNYLLNHKTKYTFDKNSLNFKGLYQSAFSSNETTAENWSLGVRYERAFSNYFSGYTGYTAEGDRFAGLSQRDSIDLGGKYFFIKDKQTQFFSEAGYRYVTEEYTSSTASDESFSALRAYLEIEHKFRKTVSGKFWIEYIPNLSESEDYQINFEPSVLATLTDVFSLKMSYLGKYDSVPAVGATENLDSIYYTSLIAKF